MLHILGFARTHVLPGPIRLTLGTGEAFHRFREIRGVRLEIVDLVIVFVDGVITVPFLNVETKLIAIIGRGEDHAVNALLVLFLFVLMLLNVGREARSVNRRPIQQVLASAAIVVFAALLLSLLRGHGADVPASAAAEAPGEIAALARLLVSEYLLAFEALSVLLLAALAGAYVLARREDGA